MVGAEVVPNVVALLMLVVVVVIIAKVVKVVARVVVVEIVAHDRSHCGYCSGSVLVTPIDASPMAFMFLVSKFPFLT